MDIKITFFIILTNSSLCSTIWPFKIISVPWIFIYWFISISLVVTLLAQQIAGGSKRMIVQIFFDDLICKVIIWWRSFAHLKLYFCKVTITKDVAETTSLLYITNSRGGFLGNTLCPLLSEASFNTWGLGVVFFWKFKIKI